MTNLDTNRSLKLLQEGLEFLQEAANLIQKSIDAGQEPTSVGEPESPVALKRAERHGRKHPVPKSNGTILTKGGRVMYAKTREHLDRKSAWWGMTGRTTAREALNDYKQTTGESYARISRRLGISPGYLSVLIYDKKNSMLRSPSAELLEKIRRTLGIPKAEWFDTTRARHGEIPVPQPQRPHFELPEKKHRKSPKVTYQGRRISYAWDHPSLTRGHAMVWAVDTYPHAMSEFKRVCHTVGAYNSKNKPTDPWTAFTRGKYVVVCRTSTLNHVGLWAYTCPMDELGKQFQHADDALPVGARILNRPTIINMNRGVESQVGVPHREMAGRAMV